jgi:hypothetical protein
LCILHLTNCISLVTYFTSTKMYLNGIFHCCLRWGLSMLPRLVSWAQVTLSPQPVG